MSEYGTRHGRGAGSLYYMTYGDDPGSFHYATYGDGPGSIYYWRYGREAGSEYFWRYGRTAGSDYYWRYGDGCLSETGWAQGARCGQGAPPVLLTLCMARVVDIEPCAIVDRELDAWIGRVGVWSSGDIEAVVARMRGGRPAAG